MKNKYIHSIITKFFDNDLPKDIQARFQRWMLDPDQREEKEEVLSEVWNNLDVHSDKGTVKKFRKLNKRINAYESGSNFISWKKVAGIAAIFALVLASAFFTWNAKTYLEAETFFTMEAPLGEKSKVILSDGTIVWLNAGSSLKYSSRFDKANRNVELRGEGYFEVTKQGGKEFVVHSQGCNVHVKGTRFNVKSYEEDPNVEISLYEGSVCLSTPIVDERNALYMNPGDIVNYNKLDNTLSKEKFTVNDYSSWKDGHLYFKDKPLREITTQLERMFNVQIQIKDSSIAELTYYVAFVNNENLEEMLDAINVDGKLRIIHNKNKTIEIYKK